MQRSGFISLQVSAYLFYVLLSVQIFVSGLFFVPVLWLSIVQVGNFMNNKTTMERFSRSNQGDDSTIKLLNSGIHNDDRIIRDCYRSMGSFAGAMKEDIESQRRLLSSGDA